MASSRARDENSYIVYIMMCCVTMTCGHSMWCKCQYLYYIYFNIYHMHINNWILYSNSFSNKPIWIHISLSIAFSYINIILCSYIRYSRSYKQMYLQVEVEFKRDRFWPTRLLEHRFHAANVKGVSEHEKEKWGTRERSFQVVDTCVERDTP